MKFCFDRVACLNIRRSLGKEWILANGLGDYASGTIPYCNTRKYHGLLVVNLPKLGGRHVLLSTTEDSLIGANKEFFFSTRKHPDMYFPRGHEYLQSVNINDWPQFHYRIADLNITRELVLVRNKSLLLMKYEAQCEHSIPELILRIKPLLAYRHFHSLIHKNDEVQNALEIRTDGLCISPYAHMPSLFMKAKGQVQIDTNSDWYYNVEYFVEAERGFPHKEDLYKPAFFDFSLKLNEPIYLAAGIDEIYEDLEELWHSETEGRTNLVQVADDLIGQLTRQGASFMITPPQGLLEVLAGYHWFDAWGRDAFISLPGLTFCAGRLSKGKRILYSATKSIRNGLVPNIFGASEDSHAYNSVDASLWYVWAAQKLLQHMPEEEQWFHENIWPAIKGIIEAYMGGKHPLIHMDEDGLIHAGNEHTQLTWMDAQVNGKPVTPRCGCPVEINALWYNALAFAEFLATRFGEKTPVTAKYLRHMRVQFKQKFWVEYLGGYLGDVWHKEELDISVRPNQIFAVSLPYPILEDDLQAHVVECVRNKLLTPFGLRTLSPTHPLYCPVYGGSPEQRDGAYHQGTVWTWLLGHYTEALLRTAWDIEGAATSLLDTITPLFTEHFLDAGIGTLSEIFDASAPHRPDGCISQAWSVAEVLRSLLMLKQAAPEAYAKWEQAILLTINCPQSR